ncbi:MAG: GGDEF domain-containing protein [Myxococcales bacterium]|nr:GGDEF domain-containing protein [Myxococcales bacterium]MCB9648270.1 GGDEF domain-containing protein [Deltaproteobacteria bacterium]
MRHSPEDASTRVGVGPPPPDEDLVLWILSGPARGRFLRVPKKGGVLGRDREVALCIDDPGISREHLRIQRNDRGYFEVEDLESRFGTFVEGDQITRQVVQDGDRIQVSAETVLRVRAVDSREPEALERPTAERIRDPLTRLYNRRYLTRRLEEEYAFARRHQTPLSLVMVDLDHFQRVNAEFGHGAGDKVLRAVARVLHATVRAEDLLCRLGGDEFCVLTRGEDHAGSLAFGERILKVLRERPMEALGQRLQLTASAGVVTYGRDRSTSMMELLVEADAALYEAKQKGRDRVQAYRPAGDPE